MNAPSGGWRGGGKKSSSPQSSSQSSSSQSHRGWKTSKKTSSSGRKKNSKKLSQFVGVSCCLLILIGIAIWIFWPNYQLHTHFVLLDPLQGNDRFPFAAKVDLPTSNVDAAGRFTVGKHSRSEASTLNFFTDEELESRDSMLGQADVCIVFIRLATLPGSDGTQLVLLKNSTSNPEPSNQHETLSDLKAKLEALPDRQQIVLIADVNSTGPDWRSGYFGNSVHQELQEWSEEIPNLVTIVSCDVGERSWPSGMPGHGGTVFEMVLQDAFTLKADQPRPGAARGDKELSLAELYEYLATNTNAWVSEYRHSGGQHVQIYPPLEEVATDQKGLPVVLMKALHEAPTREADNNGAQDLLDELPDVWERINQASTARTNTRVPVLLAAAQAQLQAAEMQLASGRLDVAQNLLEQSEQNLAEVDLLTGDVREEIPFVLSLPEKVTEHSQVIDWIETGHLVVTENSEALRQSAADLLQASWNSFPFGSSTVNRPDKEILQSVITAQNRLDKITALMFHDAHQFEPLIEGIQKELLLIQDLLFVNDEHLPSSLIRPDDQQFFRKLEEQATLIEEFVLRKLEIEALLRNRLKELPEYVAWAAGQTETPYQNELLTALKSGQVTIAPTRAVESDKLQFAITNALLHIEKLNRSYLERSQQQYKTSSEVDTALQEFNQQLKQAEKSWQEVEEFVLRIEQTIPNADIEHWQQSINALNLSQFEESIRQTLIKGAMSPWSKGMPELDQESQELKETVAEEQFQAYRQSLVWEIAWRLRLQDLMLQTSTASSKEIADLKASYWEAWQILSDADDLKAVHRQLAKVGTIIRNDWENRRNQVTTTLGYSGGDLADYQIRLLKTDLASLFFRIDDADLSKKQREVRTAYERVGHLQYCILLARQFQHSLWVTPTNKPLEHANKWFVKQADSWLSIAENLVDLDASLGVAQKEIRKRKSELAKADQWTSQIEMSPISSRSFEEQQKINLDLKFKLPVYSESAAAVSMVIVGTEPVPGEREVLDLPQNGLPMLAQTSDHQFELPVLRKFVPMPEDCSSVSLKPQIFFRGRSYEQRPVVVNPCPSTQRSWQFLAGRDSAQINVKGEDNRPIVFVLDWSYSMNDTDANGNPKQRHLAAANAVEQIIQAMPDTMKVGLVVFGHSSQQGNNGRLILNPTYENAFKDFVDIKVKDPLQDVEIIHEIGLLETDRELIKEKLNRLKTVTPYSTTPLALAITTAAQQLSRKTKSGGIILTITDGTPTDIGDPVKSLPAGATEDDIQNRQKLYNQRFADLQRALKPNEISTILFALDFGAEDLTTLNCIFGPGGKAGPCSFMGSKPSFNFPIVRASGEGDSDGGSLRDVIDNEIEPRPFQIQLANGEPVATEPLGDAQVMVTPNQSYRVRFGDVDIKDLFLANGDVVTLEVNWSKERFDVKRAFNSYKAASVSQLTTGQQDVPNTLRVNRVKRPSINTDPEFFENLEIEVMLDHGRNDRPVRKPEEMTFELAAVGDQNFQPDAVQQEYTSMNGAPGWRLTVSPWPRNRLMRLDSFWKMKRTIPDHVLPLTRVQNALSPDSAIVQGGADTPFPAVKIWHKQRSENNRIIYEVRLEPLEKNTFVDLVNLSVEIGETSILNENSSFKPDRVSHLKTIVDSGIVAHAYEYPADADLSRKVIAITSLTSRKTDALQLQNPIQILD